MGTRRKGTEVRYYDRYVNRLWADNCFFLQRSAVSGIYILTHGVHAKVATGTAIETPMEVTVRLTVRKDRPFTRTPHFQAHRPNVSNDEYYCTTGVDSDIREATRSAVRNMIEVLETEFQMDRVAAYMLCSVAGDLRMHEVVSRFALVDSSRLKVKISLLICT